MEVCVRIDDAHRLIVNEAVGWRGRHRLSTLPIMLAKHVVGAVTAVPREEALGVAPAVIVLPMLLTIVFILEVVPVLIVVVLFELIRIVIGALALIVVALSANVTMLLLLLFLIAALGRRRVHIGI